MTSLVFFIERLKERKRQRRLNKSKSSDSSLISMAYIKSIVEKLSMEKQQRLYKKDIPPNLETIQQVLHQTRC